MDKDLVIKLRDNAKALKNMPFVCEMLWQAADSIEKLSLDIDKWKAQYTECFRYSMRLFEENQNLQDVFRPLHESRWISVTERLPQDTQRCIVVSKCGEMAFASYTNNAFQYPYYMGEATHWMPLPQPPKEDMRKD